MAKITDQDILKLAKLSKISLSQDEVYKFRDDLQEIVEYVEQLSAVDVKGLKPTDQVTGLVNVMREDEIEPMSTQAELLKNVPHTEKNFIKVKRVLE